MGRAIVVKATDDLTGIEVEVSSLATFAVSVQQVETDNDGNVVMKANKPVPHGKPVSLNVETTAATLHAVLEFLSGNPAELAAILPRPKGVSSADSEAAAIRAWAKSQTQFAGKVGDKGKLSDEIISAYRNRARDGQTNSAANSSGGRA